MNKNIKNNKLQKLKNVKNCDFHCIKIQDVRVKFGQAVILDEINTNIKCGNLTTIIGRNGAGKSTLIKAILGDIPYKGKVSFQDTKSKKLSSEIKIGYVPQSINIERNTPTSVYDLFASYISNKPIFFYKDKKLYQRIKESLAIFDADQLIDKAVCDLSGGEVQRVLLAIAITPVPNLLLFDEPVSGIDKNGMELFYSTINNLKENFEIPILMISHDFEFVRKYSDWIILLDKTIIKEGRPDEVLGSPEFKEAFGDV